MKALGEATPTSESEHAIQQIDNLTSLLDGLSGGEQLAGRTKLQQVAAIQELVTRVSTCSGIDRACTTLADDLAEYLDNQVTVGITSHADAACKVRAISGTQYVDLASQRTQLAMHAMEEAIMRGKPSRWPAIKNQEQHALCALRQYVQVSGDDSNRHVTVVPLVEESGTVRGACVIERLIQEDTDCNEPSATNAKDPTDLFLSGASPLLATALGLILRAEGNRFDKFARSITEFRRSNRSKVACCILAMATVVLAIPIHYRIKCECELQPTVRRFVAAPFAAHLERSLVEPGDIVSAGDVLARIDGRDINWELAGKEAELNRATNLRDAHLAAKESGETKIAALEVQRLELAVEQLQHRASMLEIRAPITGMVVTGDHAKSEGVPLETGQVLYEIAPLDEMIVELSIPENEVRFVDAGMTATVALDAFPDGFDPSPIERVHPRAELIEHENVFLAEVNLSNPNGRLRPGMRGTAKISTTLKPIGWILFHKASEALRVW